MHPETRWNRPSCPDVTCWSIPAVGATETEVSVFLGAFVHMHKPILVVETGTFLGSTAQCIGQALAGQGFGHLYTLEIDPKRAKNAETAVAHLPVDIVVTDSLAWTPPGPIDLLFADSEYVRGTRAQEIRRFRAWASPRCVVLTHDTCDPIARGWLDALVTDGLVRPWCYISTPYGLAITRYCHADTP